MNDPTKHLPWRVEYRSPYWCVIDAKDGDNRSAVVTSFSEYEFQNAESLARMVASGSVAARLYLSLTRMLTHHGPRNDEECAIECEAKEAIVQASYILDKPRES